MKKRLLLLFVILLNLSTLNAKDKNVILELKKTPVNEFEFGLYKLKNKIDESLLKNEMLIRDYQSSLNNNDDKTNKIYNSHILLERGKIKITINVTQYYTSNVKRTLSIDEAKITCKNTNDIINYNIENIYSFFNFEETSIELGKERILDEITELTIKIHNTFFEPFKSVVECKRGFSESNMELVFFN